MADQNRKNIYIPEDQTEMFKNAEEFAKSNNMSLSILVAKSVSKFVSDAVKTAGEVSLMIKTYNNDSIIPVIKYIKFYGDKMVKSPYILYESCENEYEIGHTYTIYKTKKEKYLVYIDKTHTTYSIDIDYQSSSKFNKTATNKQECSYKLYDNLKYLVDDLGDLDSTSINELAKYECLTEYLDI